VGCNQAAVELIGAESKHQLLRVRPEDLRRRCSRNGFPFRR